MRLGDGRDDAGKIEDGNKSRLQRISAITGLMGVLSKASITLSAEQLEDLWRKSDDPALPTHLSNWAKSWHSPFIPTWQFTDFWRAVCDEFDLANSYEDADQEALSQVAAPPSDLAMQNKIVPEEFAMIAKGVGLVDDTALCCSANGRQQQGAKRSKINSKKANKKVEAGLRQQHKIELEDRFAKAIARPTGRQPTDDSLLAEDLALKWSLASTEEKARLESKARASWFESKSLLDYEDNPTLSAAAPGSPDILGTAPQGDAQASCDSDEDTFAKSAKMAEMLREHMEMGSDMSVKQIDKLKADLVEEAKGITRKRQELLAIEGNEWLDATSNIEDACLILQTVTQHTCWKAPGALKKGGKKSAAERKLVDTFERLMFVEFPSDPQEWAKEYAVLMVEAWAVLPWTPTINGYFDQLQEKHDELVAHVVAAGLPSSFGPEVDGSPGLSTTLPEPVDTEEDYGGDNWWCGY